MQSPMENLVQGDERSLQHLSLREQVDAALPILESLDQIQQIILYGSVATGTHSEDADIDLVILYMDHPLVDEREEIQTRLKSIGLRLGKGKGELDLHILTVEAYERMKRSGSGAILSDQFKDKGIVLFTRDRSVMSQYRS